MCSAASRTCRGTRASATAARSTRACSIASDRRTTPRHARSLGRQATCCSSTTCSSRTAGIRIAANAPCSSPWATRTAASRRRRNPCNPSAFFGFSATGRSMPHVNTVDVDDIYTLSPLQQGLWFHSFESPDAGVYVIQLVFALRGRLDVDVLERALQRVIDRHPVLRTTFFWEDLDRPIQIVSRTAPARIEQHDWRALDERAQHDALRTLLADDRRRGFDFSVAPLMRVVLLRMTDADRRLLWSVHHRSEEHTSELHHLGISY